MKKVIVVITFLIISNLAFSQIIDSLKQIIKNPKTVDTTKVIELVKIGWEFTNLDSSMFYANQALELSKKINFEKGFGQAKRLIALNYSDFGLKDSCLIYYNQALEHSKKSKDFETEAACYNGLGVYYKYNGEYEKAIENYNISLEIYSKMKDTISIGNIYNNLGNVTRDLGNYKKALEYHFLSLEIRTKFKSQTGIAQSYNNIGNIYYYQEEFEKAIEYYEKSLEIKIKEKNEDGMCYSYNNIGAAYFDLKNNEKAIEYQRKNYQLSKKINKKLNIVQACNAISEIFLNINMKDSAFIYISEGLEIAQAIKNKEKTAALNTKMASYYLFEKKYDLSLKYSTISLDLAMETKNIEEIKNAAFQKYQAAEKLGKTAIALENYKTYILMSDSIQNEKNFKQTVSQEFAFKEEQNKLEQEKKDIETKAEMKRQKLVRNSFIAGFLLMLVLAFVILKSYRNKKKANDLLSRKNIEIEQQKEEIITQNEQLQQKNEEILAQSEELELINTMLEKLSIVASETDNAIMIMDADANFEWFNHGFTKLYGFSFEEFTANHKNAISASSNPEIKQLIKNCIDNKKSYMYESQTIAKSGEEIWVQTTLTPILDSIGNVTKIIAIDSDIRKLKDFEYEITLKNEHITSSIRYAKTIQNAILPLKEQIDEYFENFIIFKPKDLVSGDFYWYSKVEQNENDKLRTLHFIADIDCTGHGVPGAFMSMIGNTLLNEIVNSKKIYDTDIILTNLHSMVIKSLRQDFSDNNDGMDVCFCRLEKTNDFTILNFTGAKRPLFIYKSLTNEIEQIKGDRKSIGGTQKKLNDVGFISNRFELNKGDVIYLSSDGYTDQNDKQRNKFGTNQLLKIMLENATKSIEEQGQILNKSIENWMNDTEQRDDISLIGLKI